MRSDFSQKDLTRQKMQIDALIRSRDELQRELYASKSLMYSILTSTSWKITAPLRVLSRFVRRTFRRGQTPVFENQLQSGDAHVPHSLWRTPHNRHIKPSVKPHPPPSIKFSILIPHCDTPKKHLKDALHSLKKQTYTNWEVVRGKDIAECIKASKGDCLAFLHLGDALHPSALFESAKAICESGADLIYTDECNFREYLVDAFDPFYKPDFAPDTLRGLNYISRLCVFTRQLLNKTQKPQDITHEYDLVLRLSSKANRIIHIPKVLYFRRVSDGREDVQKYHRASHKIEGSPKISIIIPNRDNIDFLHNCTRSIAEKTTYKDFEILIVENNSEQKQTFDYYKAQKDDERTKLLTFDGEFNFSKINNYAVSQAKGEYIVLLNNDTEVISENWLEEMLMFAQRGDVGAVGAKLYFPDDTIQHAGMILGLCGAARHLHYMDGSRRGDCGYHGRLITVQNLSCITAACMMLPKRVFEEVGGFNEEFAVQWGDTDLCMRIRKAGYLIVWTPFAELYHYESASRGYNCDPVSQKEYRLFRETWAEEIEAGDPYYNVNLPRDRFDFRNPEMA